MFEDRPWSQDQGQTPWTSGGSWQSSWSNGASWKQKKWGEQNWSSQSQSWSSGGNWEDQRTPLGAGVGILVEWQNKGFNSCGWIVPLHGMATKQDPSEVVRHGGDVYVHYNDIKDPRLGSVVTFQTYEDSQGRGAQAVRSRAAARFVVPRSSLDRVKLPGEEVNPASSYFKSSVFYPELEDRGVTLRRYTWESKLQVIELWGAPKDIVSAAEELGLLEHPEAEVLLSPQMARKLPPDQLREVSAADLPEVPSKCRLATSLRSGASGASPKQRLSSILGVS
eukprot:TRINITY_DN29142_c0_g1_i1.p1 TRINITY_DN29142_c0_g1~~TRINITY_DN29142_c0_g1_i1.p1  ORF type:complete len:280 (-),score=44.57 TRINITY_DN29142_c0_g1_i1:42-881(-)